MTVITENEEETRAFGHTVARTLNTNTVCLFGEMGCGKTQFVKGFLEEFGYRGDVTSPTYALCHRYDADRTVYHYDLYRLSGYDDLYSVGFFDREPGSVHIVEWSENAEEYLPDDALRIDFRYGAEPNQRILTVREDER